MSYPEPIPVLRGKAAKEFLDNLENFRLSEEQKEFYREAMKLYGKTCPGDCTGKFQNGQCLGCIRHPDTRDKYVQTRDIKKHK